MEANHVDMLMGNTLQASSTYYLGTLTYGNCGAMEA